MAGKFQSPGKKSGFSLPQKPAPRPQSSPRPQSPQSSPRPQSAGAKPAPQAPKPSAAEPLNHEQARIQEWLRTVRFRKTPVGGVDEADLWRKLQELNALYEAALSAERARYDALLKEAGNHG